ncbi:MAG: SDR family NAD(P)-dependent oxidoreductase, partial [Gemmatimonadaceae bacterium]|nr:SDR family NAD(P)-dependent oxidoreductase [Caulobacter sp.]
MFRDKTILLTGGAGGLGSLISSQLMAEGAKVVVLDRAEP